RALLSNTDVEGVALLAEYLGRSAAALVDDVLALEEFRVLAVEELDPKLGTRFLVRDRDEDEVALEGEVVPLVEKEGDELHDAHPLHVLRTATPDVAVVYLAGE